MNFPQSPSLRGTVDDECHNLSPEKSNETVEVLVGGMCEYFYLLGIDETFLFIDSKQSETLKLNIDICDCRSFFVLTEESPKVNIRAQSRKNKAAHMTDTSKGNDQSIRGWQTAQKEMHGQTFTDNGAKLQ